MPSLSELPSNLNRRSLTKALERLGFVISTKGGKGSHLKATHLKTQKSITIPGNVDKNTLYYVIKEIERCTAVTWDDIKKEL
ncbi:MAG: type II toxin-antitoxin system HicA family toxin [Patescibacteria group bacterium]